MTPTPLADVRRLSRAERRWLADARDRLRRTRDDAHVRIAPPVPPTTEGDAR